jgi:hypothetical protein
MFIAQWFGNHSLSIEEVHEYSSKDSLIRDMLPPIKKYIIVERKNLTFVGMYTISVKAFIAREMYKNQV